MAVCVYNPSTQEAEVRSDFEFQASLSYIAIHCLKKSNKPGKQDN
jgi:hypothetical protein